MSQFYVLALLGPIRERHDRQGDRVREAAYRDREPTAEVINAQSVKGAATVRAASRDFDGESMANGRRRHIVVDTLGLLLAVMVTAASVLHCSAAVEPRAEAVERKLPKTQEPSCEQVVDRA